MDRPFWESWGFETRLPWRMPKIWGMRERNPNQFSALRASKFNFAQLLGALHGLSEVKKEFVVPEPSWGKSLCHWRSWNPSCASGLKSYLGPLWHLDAVTNQCQDLEVSKHLLQFRQHLMWMCLANPSVVTKAFQRQLLRCTVLEFPSKYRHGSSLWGTNRPTQLVHFIYFWINIGQFHPILSNFSILKPSFWGWFWPSFILIAIWRMTCPFLRSHVGERCSIYCWVCWVLIILGLRIFNIRFLRSLRETISRCLFLAVPFIQTRGDLIEDPIGKRQSTDVNGAYARLTLLVFPKTRHHATNCLSLSDTFIT